MTALVKASRSHLNGSYDDASSSASGSQPRRDGFKTYRPPLSESHLRRSAMYDPHPDSAFSPLPPSLNPSKHRKDRDREGQRAELDRILEPGYKTTPPTDADDGSSSMAGPSKSHTHRTAGGFTIGDKKKLGHNVGLGIRSTQSTSHLTGRVSGGNRGGVYVDANGKIHDTEYDPFAGVSEMSRRRTRRKSAFGSERQRSSSHGTSSQSGSENGDVVEDMRTSMDGRSTSRLSHARDEAEAKRKQERERRREEEAAIKRRSMMSERSSIGGRATPSIHSRDEGLGATQHTLTLDRLANRSRSSQGHHVPSPLSPAFGQPSSAMTATFSNSSRNPASITSESPPQKITQHNANLPVPTTTMNANGKEKAPMSVPVNNKKVTVTGFDAPKTPTPVSSKMEKPRTSSSSIRAGPRLKVPENDRPVSRQSNDSSRPKPAERPREEIFPETPAQIKRRQDRERRIAQITGSGLSSRMGSLAIDTTLSSKGRILPEIEIVEDDDPRIVFPENGKTTRVQTQHDHIIKPSGSGPFSHALNAQGIPSGSALGRQTSLDTLGGLPGHLGRPGSGSKAPSSMLGESGYLPSRWASGDRELRKTEDEKDKYRPREWGDKSGEEWHPSGKDQIKRQWKDLATNARFSMFRAKKKLLRKAEL